jgi:hypothetical protein
MKSVAVQRDPRRVVHPRDMAKAGLPEAESPLCPVAEGSSITAQALGTPARQEHSAAAPSPARSAPPSRRSTPVAGAAIVTNIATSGLLPSWLRWLQPTWHAWCTVGVLVVATVVLAVVALRADADPRPEPGGLLTDRSVRVGTQSGGVNVTGDGNRVTTSGREYAQVIGEVSGGNVTGSVHAPGGMVVQAPGAHFYMEAPAPVDPAPARTDPRPGRTVTSTAFVFPLPT